MTGMNPGQPARDPFHSRIDPAALNTAQSQEKLHDSYRHARVWAEGGYSETSKAYWSGMRDTLAVVLGITTSPPIDNTQDAAATQMLGG